MEKPKPEIKEWIVPRSWFLNTFLPKNVPELLWEVVQFLRVGQGKYNSMEHLMVPIRKKALKKDGVCQKSTGAILQELSMSKARIIWEPKEMIGLHSPQNKIYTYMRVYIRICVRVYIHTYI